MSDRAAIRRLVTMFAFHLDDRNFAALAGLLDEDCIIDSAGEFHLSGRDQTIASIAANRAPHPGRHLLGPTIVQLRRPDLASAWTDMVAILPDADGALSILGTWRYHDRFARVDGRWLFTHRFLHRPAQPLTDGAPALDSPTDHRDSDSQRREANGEPGAHVNQEDQIKRLVAMYAFCLDDRDYEALAAMLSADCLLSVGEYRLAGRDQIIASVSGMQSQDPGRHLLGPTLVLLEGPDRASAWTDMVGIVPGPAGTPIIAGTWRYHDRLARHQDRWVFTHRYLHGPAEHLVDGAPALPA